MKKLTIVLVAFALMFAGTAQAQGMSNASMLEDIQQRIQRLRRHANKEARNQVAQVGQRVREMRQEEEEEGENFGERVRQMVHERTQQLKQERQEQMEQARNRFQERIQELPEQARRFARLPEGLDEAQGRVVARYEKFLEDVEEIIAELDLEELTTEQDEKLSSIEEEAAALWEDVPEKAAKSYYEEFGSEEDISFVGNMVRAFQEDHVEFMQTVLSLRQEAQALYEEVIGEEFEEEEEEEQE